MNGGTTERQEIEALLPWHAAGTLNRRPVDVASRFAQFLSNLAPRTLVWSASAAALAIMVQGAVLTSVMVTDNHAPNSVSGPGMAAAGEDGYLVVRFSPQASALEITNFLNTWKATLVDGPKNGGMFTLRLPKDVKKEDLIGIAKQMQAHSKVVENVVIKGL
jgi:hypothetical protein